jgi:23S rRNA-/tRNA-specific pseudouridylate synthase
MNITTVFRDDWLWVVAKPAGVPTQGDRAGTPDLVAALSQQSDYLGVHHRLDQPASGIVLFTVDPRANAAIAEAFREHTIERTYVAVLTGDLEGPERWAGPIDGRPATTHALPLGRGAGLSAAKLRLETGRTHQIRRHAAQAGLPLAGDRRYGADLSHPWPRLALHAAALAVTHPKTGVRQHWTVPIPADLTTLWRRAGGVDNPHL